MNYESEAFRNDTKLEGRYPNYFKVGHHNFEFVLDNWHSFSFVLRLTRNAEFKQQYICISICYNHIGATVLWLSSPWHNIRSTTFSVNKKTKRRIKHYFVRIY